MIIGLSGKIGSGKSTAANIISALLPNGTVQQAAYADKLKTICALLIGCNVKEFENQEFKQKILGDEWNSPAGFWPEETVFMTVRTLMQRVGTEAMRNNVHRNVWVNALFAEYKKSERPLWVVTDVRFQNEADAIRERDGIIIRLERDFHVKSNHESETALDDYKFDYFIDNNLGLEELSNSIKDILQHHGLYPYVSDLINRKK